MKTSLSILALASLFLMGCGGSHEPHKASANGKPAVAVRTATVVATEWPSIYEAVGTVKARTATVISSKVMGYVREVKVQVGDRVREGQLLVAIDARDLDAGWRQAEAARAEARSAMPEVENAIAAANANLELAQVTFNRMKDLFDKKSVSNQEFDEASAKLKLAKAGREMAIARKAQLASKIEQAEQGLRSADVMRGFAQVTAPFSGIVTDKPVEPGILAAPGAPLLTIEREGAFRLEAAIEESRLGSVRVGQAVTVTLDAIGRTVEGRVSEIVPAIESASRSFIVKIDLPATAELRSGVFGRARFSTGSRQALTVPESAVVEQGQLQSIFVVEGGAARARLVTLGQRAGGNVEALSGLVPGDRVVSPIPPGLADGSKVEVSQ